MNIEELFDSEKWIGYGLLTTEDGNRAIDYLKVEVMEYVAELNKCSAELEMRLGCCRDASTGKDLLIAELEKQVPKVVWPIYNGTGETDWDCPECEFRSLHRLWKYCPQCGAKLNWE